MNILKVILLICVAFLLFSVIELWIASNKLSTAITGLKEANSKLMENKCYEAYILTKENNKFAKEHNI